MRASANPNHARTWQARLGSWRQDLLTSMTFQPANEPQSAGFVMISRKKAGFVVIFSLFFTLGLVIC